jgi:hypothetical protein
MNLSPQCGNLQIYEQKHQKSLPENPRPGRGSPLAMAAAIAMENPLSTVAAALLMFVMLMTARPAAADDLFDFEQRIRTTDPYLRRLLRDGVIASPTLRKLVAHLLASDVVVYLTRAHDLPTSLEGKTTFKGAAAGVRYLSVCVAWTRLPGVHIATMAHELQHAVEIADAPWVVDERSLALEYKRIGFHSPAPTGRPPGRAFESTEAIAAGQRVWREFASKSADD